MKLHLHNRVGSLGGLQEDIENIFGHMFGSSKEACEGSCYSPNSDIAETDTGFEIVFELPGVELDDIAIEFGEDQLRVSGEKKVELVEGKTLHRQERVGGKFERTFDFPTQINSDKIDASFENGLLRITAAKSDKVLPRKISISGK